MAVTLAVFRRPSKNKGASSPQEIAISDRIASIAVITPIGQSFVQALFPTSTTEYITIINGEKTLLEANCVSASIDAKLAAHIKRFGKQANIVLRNTLSASAEEIIKAEAFSDDTMHALNPIEEIIIIIRFVKEYALAKKRPKKAILVCVPDKNEDSHRHAETVGTFH